MSSTLENSPSPPVSTEREILPRHLKPIHYDITIEPHLEAVYFDGSVVIDLAVVEDTSSITLNAIDLEILETEVLVGDGSVLPVSNMDFDSAKETLTIKVEEMLTIGQNVKLKQSFKGSLLHNTSGLFRSPVVRKDGTTKWMVSTQFEATDARRVFPSFDEPGLKATFSITLVADKTLTCLGNMDVAYETDAGEGRRAVTFNRTPLMSTYIVAFAIGDLKMIETTDFRVPVRVYASADKNIEHGRFALQLASRTLKAFEKIFDIDFPLPKLDLIAIPGEDGAMENWGLVTFADCFLLVDETDSSVTALRLAGSVIVHELAHQWFGNLVTMEFWDGLWLNESFADWAELYAWETLEPSWQMWQNYATGGVSEGSRVGLKQSQSSHRSPSQ
jgi:aminopeptidase 2